MENSIKKLIVGQYEINTFGLECLLSSNDPQSFADTIDDVISNLAQIGAFILTTPALNLNDVDSARNVFPNPESIHYLKLLSDSLKKF